MGPIAAGSNAPVPGRVNWQQTFEQGVQARQAQFKYSSLIDTRHEKSLHHITRYNHGAYLQLTSPFFLLSSTLIVCKPNNSTNRWNFDFTNSLLKIFAGLSSVGTYTTDNFPASTVS